MLQAICADPKIIDKKCSQILTGFGLLSVLLSFQQLAAALICVVIILSLSVSPAHGQNAGNPTEGDSATPARLPDSERTEAPDARAEENVGNPLPIAADALNAYLRQIIEAQGATIAALQAQVEELKGQQTLQQAATAAQQAQQALGDAVAKLAKESGAADGARLALDGSWIAPALVEGGQSSSAGK